MTGEIPFNGDTVDDLVQSNNECHIEFNSQIWANISSEGKDLTQKMVNKDPSLRISVKEALEHPWFTMETIGSTSLSMPEINIKKYFDKKCFNVESIKPDFNSIKSPLLKDNINLLGSSSIPKKVFSCLRILPKEKKQENDSSSSMIELDETKTSSNSCQLDASNFPEDDISESEGRSSHMILTPINKSVENKGLSTKYNKYKEKYLNFNNFNEYIEDPNQIDSLEYEQATIKNNNFIFSNDDSLEEDYNESDLKEEKVIENNVNTNIEDNVSLIPSFPSE